jgi:hypothetical protein
MKPRVTGLFVGIAAVAAVALLLRSLTAGGTPESRTSGPIPYEHGL